MDVKKYVSEVSEKVKRKRKVSDFRYLLYALILLILVMFILSFFSVDTYSIIKNTTSHLGAPDYSGIWQRSMFMISFVWLIFMLERIRDFNKTV